MKMGASETGGDRMGVDQETLGTANPTAMKDTLRWGLMLLALLAGLSILTMNAIWSVQGKHALERGLHKPSLVPLAAPVFAIVAAVVAPSGWVALALPLYCAFDLGTIATIRTLVAWPMDGGSIAATAQRPFLWAMAPWVSVFRRRALPTSRAETGSSMWWHLRRLWHDLPFCRSKSRSRSSCRVPAE